MNAEKKLKGKQPGNSKQHSNKRELTEREVEELMSHSSYKRRGGAIRQVRQG